MHFSFCVYLKKKTDLSTFWKHVGGFDFKSNRNVQKVFSELQMMAVKFSFLTNKLLKKYFRVSSGTGYLPL